MHEIKFSSVEQSLTRNLIELKYANPVYLPISCDFSVVAVNWMLDKARDLDMGSAVRIEFQIGDWSIPEWCIRFEKGDIVSRGVV